MFTLPVSLRIRAPLEQVFAAWVDPRTAEHWQCERITGEWKPGSTVTWDYGSEQQVLEVTELEPSRFLRFEYKAYRTQAKAQVAIEFVSLGQETGLRLTETGWPLDAEGAAIVADHACGWENMFCRLKVYLELGHGFDFRLGCFRKHETL